MKKKEKVKSNKSKNLSKQDVANDYLIDRFDLRF